MKQGRIVRDVAITQAREDKSLKKGSSLKNGRRQSECKGITA